MRIVRALHTLFVRCSVSLQFYHARLYATQPVPKTTQLIFIVHSRLPKLHSPFPKLHPPFLSRAARSQNYTARSYGAQYVPEFEQSIPKGLGFKNIFPKFLTFLYL